jgi:hypothetical protein
VIARDWEQQCDEPRLCMKLCVSPHLSKAYMCNRQHNTPKNKKNKKRRELGRDGSIRSRPMLAPLGLCQVETSRPADLHRSAGWTPFSCEKFQTDRTTRTLLTSFDQRVALKAKIPPAGTPFSGWSNPKQVGPPENAKFQRTSLSTSRNLPRRRWLDAPAVRWLRIWVLGCFMGLPGPSISFLVPRFPSKSGLIHKHIVKHIVVGHHRWVGAVWFRLGAFLLGAWACVGRRTAEGIPARQRDMGSQPNVTHAGKMVPLECETSVPVPGLSRKRKGTGCIDA